MTARLKIIRVVSLVVINILALSLTAYSSIPIGGETGNIEILPGGEKAYIANRDDDTVVVIDTDPSSCSFNTVVGTVPVGQGPLGIAITPDATRVYVTNNWENSISVISTVSDSVIATINDAGSAPGGIAITPDGTRGYFTAFENMVKVLDTDPNSTSYHQVIGSIEIPLLLYGKIAITPDGTKAVVNWAGMIAHAVNVIDVDPESSTYNTVIGSPVPVVAASLGDVAVSPDSAFAYATGYTSYCGVCKIDLQTFDILINYELPWMQWQNFIALTPDGSSLHTAGFNTTAISVFDTSDLSLFDSVELDAQLRDIAITPDGSRAYIVRYPISANSEVVMVPLLPSNQSPVAVCQDVTVPTEPGLCSAEASVDAGSFDPDGDQITQCQSPLGPYLLGTTDVTLTVTDDKGAFDACSATITVVDQEPPFIQDLSVSPDTLWSPNHKMVFVSVNVSASDNCAGTPACQIISVSSNEPQIGLGDGDTAPDWLITGDLTVDLRAERSGTGSGRVYTITVECTDTSGNASTETREVTVPHDYN